MRTFCGGPRNENHRVPAQGRERSGRCWYPVGITTQNIRRTTSRIDLDLPLLRFFSVRIENREEKSTVSSAVSGGGSCFVCPDYAWSLRPDVYIAMAATRKLQGENNSKNGMEWKALFPPKAITYIACIGFSRWSVTFAGICKQYSFIQFGIIIRILNKAFGLCWLNDNKKIKKYMFLIINKQSVGSQRAMF